MTARNSNQKQTQTRLGLLSMLLLTALLALILLLSARVRAQSAYNESPDGVWAHVSGELSGTSLARLDGVRGEMPQRYRTLQLAPSELAARLELVAGSAAPLLYLPAPDGRYLPFYIQSVPIMAPELAARYPQIETYLGVGADDPTLLARLDWTPHGFHGMVMGGDGRIFIDPLTDDPDGLYISYAAADFVPDLPADFGSRPDFELGPETETAVGSVSSAQSTPQTGSWLRTYRLAMAATAEYTAFHDDGNPGNGDAVADALSAIVTTVNRVSGIYERDIAIRLQLVANNDAIIFSGTDPYVTIYDLGQNQAVIDSIIGSANYDIGHVLGTESGGLAALGVVCHPAAKARGATGLPVPEGDPFDVDYVAHEIGHQFSANHTYNSNNGFCVGQRNDPTAYEPGSGSTIMAYAGICGSQNLQSNSDAYFHGISIDEIVQYTTQSTGATCGQLTETGNSVPVVEAGESYTIPINTPFVLEGAAADAEQSVLAYAWEQFDLGPFGVDPLAVPNPAFGDYPIFRSFSPVNTAVRTFPRLDDIVNNISSIGEVLSPYARTLNFRLTVRDLAVPAGGVAYDETTVEVVETAGPFLVTGPNTAVTWTGGSSQTISWDVAGTDQSPVSCAQVDISLSTDGGFTYPWLLLTTANDGSADVTLPNIATGSGRVRVQCHDNIFFDISNADFTIQQGAGSAALRPQVTVPVTAVNTPGTLTYTIGVANEGDIAANATITSTFPAGLTDPVCAGQPGNLQETAAIAAGNEVSYNCELTAPDYLELMLGVDQPLVDAGTAVAYTMTVANSSDAVTLTNVALQLTGAAGCTPSLGSVTALTPEQEVEIVCAGNVVNGATTAVATASAQLTVTSSAAAQAPEDPRGEQVSPPVATTLFYAAEDSVQVMVAPPEQLFLPLIQK